MVMRRPKKASSLRSPRGVERCGGTEPGTPAPHGHQGCAGEHPFIRPAWHPPYLSRKRKKRVSTMVMRTPPQRGMLQDGKGWPVRHMPLSRVGPQGRLGVPHETAHRPADSRLKAMAVPITSCMSEPMMAISIMSHSSTRGTWGDRGIEVLEPTARLGPGQNGTMPRVGTPVPRLWQATQSSNLFHDTILGCKMDPQSQPAPPPHPCPSGT